jgi:HlyD family secretion protein
MAHDPLRQLIRSIGQLGEAAGAAVSDAALLRRFVRSSDQAAFELLVWRHGPMILSVCRRLLADAHDAEDAFQTTFLVLVRKAGAVRRSEALAGWLHQVAYRVCLRIGTARAKRAAREQPGVEAIAAPDCADNDVTAVLDDEINRLPDRQRVAFILCCLEGKTGEEAAHLLGCPPGTVSSRITRARERLRIRLRRRGIAVPAGIALGVAADSAAAALPPALLTTTVTAAAHFAVGGFVSPQTLSHVEGVLRAMFVTKLKNAACLVAMLGALFAGGIVASQALLAQQQGPLDPHDPPQAAPKAGKERVGPIVVTVVKPQQGPLPRISRLACSVLPSVQVDVYAAVGGVLKGVDVDLGSQVKKGQLLAEIESPHLALEVELADNAVQQVQNLVAQDDANVETAQAEVERAKNLVRAAVSDERSMKAAADEAASRYERELRLSMSGGIGAPELSASLAAKEKFRFDWMSKEAGVAIAKSDILVMEGKRAQMEAARRVTRGKLSAAQIGVAKARVTLSLTKITSPIDGIITKRNRNAGDLVRDTQAGSQLPIVTVQRIDPLRVVAEVPESEIAEATVGTRVDLSFAALGGVPLKDLKIARTGFAVDPKTGSVRVEIDLANPDERLRPGMAGSVGLHLKPTAGNVLRVPTEAVLWRSQPGAAPRPHGGFGPPGAPGSPMGMGPGMPGSPMGPQGIYPKGTGIGEPVLYVVRGGKAHLLPVQLGQSTTEEMEVVSGIRADDLVVTNPSVLQGAAVPVEIKQAREK